jgi:hypothetical protein
MVYMMLETYLYPPQENPYAADGCAQEQVV